MKQTHQEILNRVLGLRKSASGSFESPIDAHDETNKGTKSIPTDPKNTRAAENRPENEKNQSLEGDSLMDKQLHPTSTGKNVPGTEDGGAKEDAYTAPNTPIEKISQVAKRLKSLTSSTKEASETETEGKTKEASEKEEQEKEASEKEDKSEKSSEDISPDVLLKLASAILETEEGIQFANEIITKQAGREVATQLLTEAANAYDYYVEVGSQEEELEKQAAYEQAVYEQQLQETFDGMTKEAQERAINTAHFHKQAMEKIEDEFLKAAYMGGAEDAEAMMADEAGMIPGAVDEGAGASIEEIIMAIDELVQAGEITEEEAIQIAEMLLSEEGGDMGGGMGGGEMMPEEIKMASVVVEKLTTEE